MDALGNPSNVSFAYAAYAVVGVLLGGYLLLLVRRLARQQRALAAWRAAGRVAPPQQGR